MNPAPRCVMSIRWLRGAWIAVRWGWAQGCAEKHERIASRARLREARARDDYRALYPSVYRERLRQ